MELRTRILPKMINSEVEAYLEHNDIIIVPGIESVPVIPHESPAVVYADMVSNSTFSNVSVSGAA